MSLADTLRAHGYEPCSVCAGEGVIKARTAMFEMTAVCGRCLGDGREPEQGAKGLRATQHYFTEGGQGADHPHERTDP